MAGAALVADVALGAPGDLDTSFSGDGYESVQFPGINREGADDVAVQDDGRIVVVGTAEPLPFDDPSGPTDILVARFTQDGALDSEFSEDGWTTVHFDQASARGGALALTAEGTIWVTGTVAPWTSDTNHVGVARLLSDGSPDPTFGDGGQLELSFENDGFSDLVTNIELQPDGAAVLAGRHQGGHRVEQAWYFARLLPDGDLDPSFSGDGLRRLWLKDGRLLQERFGAADIAVDHAGRIVAVGGIQTRFGSSALVARLESDGSRDFSFADRGRFVIPTGAVPEVRGFSAVQPVRGDGLVLAGVPCVAARLRPDGTLHQGFSQDGVGTLPLRPPECGGGFSDIALDEQRRIVLGGTVRFRFDQPYARFALARITLRGKPDRSFGDGGRRVLPSMLPSGIPQVESGLDLDPEGRPVLAGTSYDLIDDYFQGLLIGRVEAE